MNAQGTDMSIQHAIERSAQGSPRGLLVLLHGVGANERSLATLAAAQAPDLTVLLPRGPLTLGPGAHAWFQVAFGPRGPVINPQQAEASRVALIDFIAAAQQRLGMAPAQTLVAGFSQGGIMSASVALTDPQLVAGFGLLSGRILPEIAPLVPADLAKRPPQALVMHGRQDSKLPFTHAEESTALLQKLGVPCTLRAYDEDHGLNAQMVHDFGAWVAQTLR
ncbi:phospholipase [Corticibacter populi]|uniref:Phospholipase n=1 Tax=Corticibacter populi TaxID=1550736 RepID=A0A3M6QY89_9BURK|nr:prolyl oligopeptidase family serine peptidase [Corticibacter populi]RMX07891.1 phospholipase [Corticibacter populi]RZS35132.1 phospholipase/carboxylesterase [Corticibacter populi]